MADQKLSAITDQMNNPSDGDRIHIIHSSSGVWSDYFIELGTLKEYSNNGVTGGAGLKISSYTMVAAGEIVYEAERYELIQTIILKPSTTQKMKVGTLVDDDYYVEETDSKSNPCNIYMDDANISNRTMRINVDGACEVKLISILNL